MVFAPLSVFPPWVPVEALFIGLVSFIVAVLLMNKGRWRMVNVVAQDESFVVALGVTIAAASGWLSGNLGAEQMTWMVIGAAVSIIGLVIWRSENLDISGPL